MISVGRIAQGGEWSRFRRQDSYSSLLEKNSPDISLFYCEADIISELTDVSERLAQMIYEDYMTVDVDYCGGYVPLFVRHIFFQNSQM